MWQPGGKSRTITLVSRQYMATERQLGGLFNDLSSAHDTLLIALTKPLREQDMVLMTRKAANNHLTFTMFLSEARVRASGSYWNDR